MFKLKIKDDIKLSQLKKYGFERCDRKYKYIWTSAIDNWGFFRMDNTAFEIIVRNDRTLEFNFGLEFDVEKYEPNLLNAEVWSNDENAVSFYMMVLYDLIKADLVEKVDD